jgi:hypothetical protein
MLQTFSIISAWGRGTTAPYCMIFTLSYIGNATLPIERKWSTSYCKEYIGILVHKGLDDCTKKDVMRLVVHRRLIVDYTTEVATEKTDSQLILSRLGSSTWTPLKMIMT